MYRGLFELAPTPTAVFDMDGCCILVNSAFSQQLGFGQDALLQGEVRFKDLFLKVGLASSLIEELEERQVIRRREVVLRDNEGRTIPTLFSGRTFDNNGVPCFDVSLTDISRQKHLERALKRDHARMASLIESITAGIFLVNNDGIITEANLALGNLVRTDRTTLVGRSFQELFAHLLSGALEPVVVQQSLSHAVNALVERPVIEIARDLDVAQYLEVSFFSVWDEDGTILGWGGLVQDVTEERDRLAWKLDLLSILAHDIRTPLATLKGHATALLANFRQWGDSLVLEFLDSMDRTTDKLVRQVDRSLALTRVEAGRLGLRPESVDPMHVVQQSIERAAGVLTDISVESDLKPESARIRADPARLEEVIVNLLDNAVRYSPSNAPIVIQGKIDGPLFKFSVTDQGPGIPNEKKYLIFDKHVRGEYEGEGTGLGLFIARKIVEAHGGQIWVESPPEGFTSGARFYFTIPLMPSQTITEKVTAKGFAVVPGLPRKDTRVLVVEDEPDTQSLLHAILSDEGYQVEIASDGPTALDVFRTAPPDLVLLDWMLPGMNGLIVCRTIRRWSPVPILLVTSKASQTDLVTALDAGADDYIVKPFQAPELLARMRALLRRGETWITDDEELRFSEEGLLIDFDSREVWLRGEGIDLTPTEFDLLAYLIRNRGQVLTYSQLVEHIWGLDRGRNRHDLFVHVSRLRGKIELNPKEPRYIVTRWGVGYMFMSK
jgi:PAS domain S-box-containing protein